MGIKSQAFGVLFESLFETACKARGVHVTRIPDGCRSVGKKIIRVRTPWDWVLSYEGKTALIDTKTVSGRKFSYSGIVDHQMNELCYHAEQGTLGGYIIWLRQTDEVLFVRSNHLLKSYGQRGSFGLGDLKSDVLGYLRDRTFDIRKIFL